MGEQKYHRILRFQDQIINLHISRRRRKTMAIHVFPGDSPVELRVPLKCPWVDIEAFLASKLQWIFQSVSELANEPTRPEMTYQDGELHYFLGDAYPLSVTQGSARVQLMDGGLNVRCADPANTKKVQAQLEKYFRGQCLPLFRERLSCCLKKFPIPLSAAGIRVRKMKSRWGSCSREGEICLNTALVQQPVGAIDFVISHELCHLAYFRHDKAFYELLDRAMPNWREWDRFLGGNLKKPYQFRLF